MFNTDFFKKLFHQLKTDPIPDLAATLAYYFMLAIFPLMIFVLAIVSFVDIDYDEVYVLINDYFPGEVGETFTQIVLDTVGEPQGALFTIGILGTLWSASNGINAFIRAVNRAYNIEETRHFLKLRGTSIILTIGMVLLVVITLVLPVFGQVILSFLEEYLFIPPELGGLLNNLRWVIGAAIMIVTLMFLYWISPNKKVQFKDGFVGALFATFGWLAISFLFSLYVSNYGNYASTYGSIAGVIILMLWFFITGIILIVGAEINATLRHMRKTEKKKV
ncbi:YihY/virulence factor BrkB family protein [Shouchella shacheensis]|uniref:YihY/virulence factor BrkB family protein n=1 Tax=Shouchella shacheensis TaxID=1649580 RepID=UPI00073FAD7A|nr:YihY/virulence factor BrkB family protein [Shouchella shacheensis]